MPSGVSDSDANAAIDWMIDTQIGGTKYLDLFTTAPTDDNGTGAVSWGQGRVSVAMATVFASASSRAATSSPILSATNTSGSTITVVAWGLFTASTGGTYRAGAPVDGGSIDVEDGGAINLTLTLASPSPSA